MVDDLSAMPLHIPQTASEPDKENMKVSEQNNVKLFFVRKTYFSICAFVLFIFILFGFNLFYILLFYNYLVDKVMKAIL